MAYWVGVNNAAGQNAGTTTTATTVSITPTLPTGAASGDRIFVVECGSNTSGTTPANWNVLGTKDLVVGSGAVSAGAGQRYLTISYRDYDGVWSMPAFTLTSAAQNSHWIGAVAVRKSNPTSTFDTPTISTAGADFGTANTAHSAVTGAFTTHRGGVLFIATVQNDNVTFISPTISQSFGGFDATAVTELCDGGTATGNDIAGQLHTVAAVTESGNPITFGGTLSAASQGGSLVFEQTETAAAGTFDVGYKSVTAGTDSGTGYIRDEKIVLAQAGIIQSISLFWGTAAGNVRAGVYADNGSTPQGGALVASTAETAVVAGWQKINVITPTTLAAGTYWICQTLSGAAVFRWCAPGGGTYCASTFAYAALPSTQPTVDVAPAAGDYPMFASFTLGATGTIAAQLAKALFSGVGGQTQTGTVAAILKKAVASLTGGGQPTGTVAAAMKKSTASFTGAQIQAGAIAATLRKPTASLTGAMQPKGAIAATAKKSTASLTGKQTQTGTVAATMKKATAALTGAMQPKGVLTGTARKMVAALTGTQQQTGVVAAASKKLTASLAGAQQPKGTISATAKRAAFTGAGAQAQSGTAAMTLKRATAALAGVMQPKGAIAATARRAAAALAGAQEQPGTIFAAMRHPVTVMAGVMQPSGFVTVTLRPAVFAASGAQTQTGAIAAAAKAAVASMVGAMRPEGVIAAAMKAALFTGSGAQATPPGTVASTMKKPTTSLSGHEAPEGAVAAAMNRALFSGQAQEVQQGIVATALRVAIFAAVGNQRTAGAIAVVLHKMVFSGAGTDIGLPGSGTMFARSQRLIAALTGAMAPVGGVTVTLRPMKFSGSSELFDITGLRTALHPLIFTSLRIAHGSAERTTIIVGENRTTVVPGENRTTLISGENRITLIE